MNETIKRDAIHTAFGLSYSNYLVVPRTLLQSMPDEWQTRFVACLNELNEAFAHVDQAEVYKVDAAREVEVGDLTTEELKAIGYSKNDDCDCHAYIDPATDRLASAPPVCPHESTFWDDKGNEVASGDRALWPVPDPVPHYNRGRARVEPNLLGQTDSSTEKG